MKWKSMGRTGADSGFGTKTIQSTSSQHCLMVRTRPIEINWVVRSFHLLLTLACCQPLCAKEDVGSGLYGFVWACMGGGASDNS